MNTGSHYRPDDSHFDRIVELGTGLLKNGFGDERNKLFVWRTTAMGHEGCKNISAPLPAPPPPYKSNTSFEYHWPLFEHQNSIAINTLRQYLPNLRVVDAYHMSERRADMHPVVYVPKGARTPRSTEDCLHWCIPGPPDWWNALTLQYIHEWRSARHNSSALFKSLL